MQKETKMVDFLRQEKQKEREREREGGRGTALLRICLEFDQQPVALQVGGCRSMNLLVGFPNTH